jgi:fucose permease
LLAVFAALNGVGLGLVIPATNMAVSDSFPRNRAAALNLINLSWSVGAIACPAIMAVARKTDHLGGTLLVIATLTVGIGLAMARAKIAHAGNEERTTSATLPRLFFVVLAALFFLYIGSEGAVANWLATYAKRTVLSSGVLWMTAPSFFWAAMMLGRAAAPSILRKVNEPTVVVGGLAVSALGVVAILAGTTPVVVLSGAVAGGLGMCSVFPIFIAMVSHIFGEAATKVSSYMFAMAGLGGAVLPWLVGVVSSHTGRLQVGLFVALAGIVVQIVLFHLLPRPNLGKAD